MGKSNKFNKMEDVLAWNGYREMRTGTGIWGKPFAGCLVTYEAKDKRMTQWFMGGGGKQFVWTHDTFVSKKIDPEGNEFDNFDSFITDFEAQFHSGFSFKGEYGFFTTDEFASSILEG